MVARFDHTWSTQGLHCWRAILSGVHTLTREQIVQAFTRLDAADIRFLADRRGLRSASDVLDVVVRYVPVERLPVRTRLLLEEMFDDGR